MGLIIVFKCITHRLFAVKHRNITEIGHRCLQRWPSSSFPLIGCWSLFTCALIGSCFMREICVLNLFIYINYCYYSFCGVEGEKKGGREEKKVDLII